MILRPEHFYTFFRQDPIRHKKENDDASIDYPYIGEILSDSWGGGKEPKDRLLWDEDSNSGDFWKYDDIYPELIEFVNQSIREGFHMHVCETVEDHTIKPNDYFITDSQEIIIK